MILKATVAISVNSMRMYFMIGQFHPTSQTGVSPFTFTASLVITNNFFVYSSSVLGLLPGQSSTLAYLSISKYFKMTYFKAIYYTNYFLQYF